MNVKLFTAAAEGNIEQLRLLLENGADIQCKR
ncbi:ankyrin repeat domain-containing protein [Avibacterium paragallinarum]